MDHTLSHAFFKAWGRCCSWNHLPVSKALPYLTGSTKSHSGQDTGSKKEKVDRHHWDSELKPVTERPSLGKEGTFEWKKVHFFFLKNKYLHPIECRNLSYAGLFVTYFGTATKRKEKLFLLCTLPWHYKTKQSCTHVFAYLSQITICRTLFIQSGCNLENNQDLSTLLF